MEWALWKPKKPQKFIYRAGVSNTHTLPQGTRPRTGVGPLDISSDLEPIKGYVATHVGWHLSHVGTHLLLGRGKCLVHKPVDWEAGCCKQLRRVSSWWRSELKCCSWTQLKESIWAISEANHLQNIVNIAPKFDWQLPFGRQIGDGNLSSYTTWFLTAGTMFTERSW